MKVYCYDCKYLTEGVMSGHLCIGRKIYKTDAYGGYYKADFPKELNKKNNCIYYKRKWYKFGKPKEYFSNDGKLSIAENKGGEVSLI